MTPGLRLRQICLVASHIEPVVGDIAGIMGLDVCCRDPNVGKYGLENALLPVDAVLLEVVAPFQGGTAAGRFLDKTGGRGGYMAIFSCDDPRERGINAERLGVRTAHVIDRPPYLGVQLHPRDCRAAFIEFNHTTGSDDPRGPYPPAGPDWHTAIRHDRTRKLVRVEMQSPEPAVLAAHWSAILGAALQTGADGRLEIKLVNCTLQFDNGAADALSGLVFEATDAGAIKQAAQARGYVVNADTFTIGGVDIRISS